MSLWELDREAFRLVHSHLNRAWLDPFAVAVTAMGLGHVQAAALLGSALRRWRWMIAALGAIGLAAFDAPLSAIGFVVLFALVMLLERGEAVRAFVAAALAGLVRLGIAHAVDRPRPSNLEFADPLERVFLSPSFPSGHATTAFAIASVVVLATWGTPRRWIGGWFALWAALVGVSRVYVGVHYPSDMLAGAFLGLACACLATFIRVRAD